MWLTTETQKELLLHIWLIIPFGLIMTCHGLDHENPLDPEFIVSRPTSLTAQALNDTTIEIAWVASTTSKEGYVVQWLANGDQKGNDTLDADASTHTITNLIFGQPYEFRVSAFTSQNSSEWSTISKTISFTAPSGLVVTGDNDPVIRLSWTDNTEYETGFIIERKNDDVFVEINRTSYNREQYSDRGVLYGHSYSYRVRAFTSDRESSSVESNFTSACSSCILDIDGTVYSTVTIGNQLWLQENLRKSIFNNGDSIPRIIANENWYSNDGAWCYFNNDETLNESYGKLYNWKTVCDERGIAPPGYHVATDADWQELELFLGMNDVEVNTKDYFRGTSENIGSKMAGEAILWEDGALLQSNEFGSTSLHLLPGGYRSSYDGEFYGMESSAYYWSGSSCYIASTFFRRLSNQKTGIYRGDLSTRFGMSVRCVRDTN